MDAKEKADYKVGAKIIKAIAHPIRVYIVDELKRQERCVNVQVLLKLTN